MLRYATGFQLDILAGEPNREHVSNEGNLYSVQEQKPTWASHQVMDGS